MLFKLSLKNIKKSVKDYSIYFFTLVFAVAMFYMFNSLDAQSSMLVLNNSKYELINDLVVLIGYVSIFVSVILGFLIVYSNNFLIKRRKKEIGMYEILGMSKRKVSLILFLETVIVGIISLIVGLLAGVFLSQFLSIFVAKMFEVDMSSFKFVFSSFAFNKTILYFGIIFILVIIFNVLTLNRYKLIDLISADKKNESVKIRNKYVTIISFILSVTFLGIAYYLLLHEKALITMDIKFTYMIISGIIGTFLLFFSLSGFLLKIFEHTKGVYYKGLNIFTLKQVNSRINTTVISTSVICLMLLLTIGMLSGSMSLARVFNSGLKENNLTDFTVRIEPNLSYVKDDNNVEVMDNEVFVKSEEIPKKESFKKYVNEYVAFHRYGDKLITLDDLMTKEDIEKAKKEYGNNLSFDATVPIISETEYASFMKLIGEDVIDIKDNEYLLIVNIDMIIDFYKNRYEEKLPLTINNQNLVPGSDHIIRLAFENNASAGNDGVLVVSDHIINGLDLLNVSYVGNFNSNNDEEAYGEELFHALSEESGVGFDYRTRKSMENSSLGLKVVVTFIGLYLGVTFAISSATVLAIGQLSESSDNKKRYKVLGQIGADNKMINKALFTQIAITFMFPLIVALVHSYFGLKEVNGLLVSIGNIDLTSNILLTTLFMVVVYGGYFLITYWCSKGIIKNNN